MPNLEDGASVEAQAAETQQTETPSFDRAALEAKVSESLAAAFGDDTEETAPATDESADSSKAEEKETEEAKTGEDEGQGAEEQGKEEIEIEGKPEETEEAAAEAGKKPDNAPTLPDAYRRSLKAYGWQDEDIDKNLSLLGNEFLKTAALIHSNRNAETARTAEIGRQARQQQQEQAGNAQQQKASGGIEPLKPVDADALKEHLGDDPIVEKLVGPVNAAIERINQILPEVYTYRQSAQQAELETLGKQIDEFFGDKGLEPYREVYGDGTRTLTEQQIRARNKVLETADALVLGAKIQGRKLTLGEALQAAHDSVSGEFKEKAVRATIKKTLTQRARGITLKPSSGKPSSGGGVESRSDLEKKTAERLRAAFA